ncbi:amidohydrolase [Tersicoccus phoenicis]|uniref:Amidohydrolase n=1 Tax=Tersicoccus phoenicis TaxID=554083 RepID=A0A1R1L8X1_9MICC|nr:amidohydrolase [Tersicoccus phoenicis]OMH23978.1 amidohydrolase [Tersicoccus phoenicis]
MSTNEDAAIDAVAQILRGQAGITDWQHDLYRTFHQHPELSNQEVKTAERVAQELTQAGYEVTEKIGTTGVVGVLANGDGPVVLMRADMDALPVQEDTGLDYASTATAEDAEGTTVPVAHACGHDVHVACLLGAARLLAEAKGAWSGTFVALFQPAEEDATGAREMVEDGLAETIPAPDVAFAQHVLAFPAGRVSPHPGPFLSSADSMRITVHGRGAHGSMPQLSVDPVVLASAIVMRLQTVVSREVAPDDFAVVTIGRISGGSKSNIIADRAVLELNIRTFDTAVSDRVIEAIKRIATAEAQASGAPAEPDFELFDHYPLTENDADTTARLTEAFTAHFGEAVEDRGRQSASEDFSDIPTALGVPYSYWGIGGIDPDTYAAAQTKGTVDADIPANHSPQFAPVLEPTLSTGTATIVVAALVWLAPEAHAD